jgi:hypothetical protein
VNNSRKRNTLVLSILFVAISAILLSQLGLFTAHATGITKYARTAGGNWSADATWSTTSGGGADTVAPTSNDDVVFDANSGNVTIDATATAKTLIQTGYTNVLTQSAFFTLTGGTMTLLSGKYNWTLQTIQFNAAVTLTSGGNVLPPLYQSSGTLTLGDNLTIYGGSPAAYLLLGSTGSANLAGHTISGTSITNRVLIYSGVVGSPRTITTSVAGSAFANADFQDIAFANGGANLDLSAIPGLSGDCGGNSMSGGGTLTFTPATPQTWKVTTGGNWSDVNNWTSRVPLAQDNVSFGNMSANQTITVDMPRIGKDVSFASATNTPTVNFTTTGLTYTVYGSLNLTGIGTFSCTKGFSVGGRTAGLTITSAGKAFTSSFLVYAANGTYTLADALNIGSYNLQVLNGMFVTAGYSVTCGGFYSNSSNTRSVDISNSTITMSGQTVAITSAGLTAFTTTGSTIALTYTGATASTFSVASGLVVNNITIAPGSGVLTFSGAFTFANMSMSSAGARTVKFTKSTTYTMTGTSFLTGTADNPTMITDPTTLNGGFETLGAGSPDVFGSWAESTAGTSTVNAESGTNKYAGTYSARLDIDSSNSVAQLTQNVLTVGKTYKATAYIKVASGSPAGGVRIGTTSSYTAITPTTSYVNYVSYFTADATGFSVVRGLNTGNNSIYIDNITLQESNAIIVNSDDGSTNFTLTKSSGTIIVDYVNMSHATISGTGKWYLTPNSVGGGNTQGNTGWTTTGIATASPAGGNWSATTAWNEGVVPTSALDTFFIPSSGNVTIDAAAVCKALTQIGYTNTLTHNTSVTWSAYGNVALLSGKYVASTASSSFWANSNLTLTTGGNAMGSIHGNGGIITLGDNVTFVASQTAVWGMVGNDLNLNGKTISGASATNRVLIYSSVAGTSHTITVSGGTFANADFQDIAFANGGANLDLSGITGGSGDCGGNSMSGGGTLTLTPATTQTWNGTSGGNWSTNAWSGHVPLPQDTVAFGTLSTSQTITVDMPRIGGNVSFASATNSPTVVLNTSGMTYSVFGNVNLTGAGTVTSGPAFTFSGRSNSSFTSAGKSLGSGSGALGVAKPGYTLTLADVFTGSNSSYFSVSSGTLSSIYAVTTYQLQTAAAGSVIMGGGATWTLTGANSVFTGSGSINAGTSTIALTYTGATVTSFAGGTNTYNNITIAPGSGVLTFSGAFSFANMTMSGTGAKIVKFTNGTTYTMTGNSFLTGTADNPTMIIGPANLNGGFETAGGGGADVFGSWWEGVSGTSTINNETASPYAGSHAMRFDIDAQGHSCYVYQNVATVGKVYKVTFWAKTNVGTAGVNITDGYSTLAPFVATTTYAQYTGYFSATHTGLYIVNGSAASQSIYIDNVTLQETNAAVVSSDTAGSQFTLNKTSGTVVADYDAIKDSNVTGGAKWYLTNNSVNISNNTGWTASGAGNVKTVSPAGGNWSANTAWNEGSPPSASDDVVATSSSGNLTIDSGTPVAKSVDFSSYGAHTLSHTTGIGLTVSGNLIFCSAMTYTPADDTAKILINGTGNITTATKQLGNFEVSGAGITVTFQDPFTQRATTTTLTLTQGTLNTNNQAVNVGIFSSSNSNPRTLILGSSNVTISGAGTVWNTYNASGLTFNANTSTITLTGSTARIYNPGSSHPFNNVIFNGGGISYIADGAGGGTKFANLTVTGTVAKTDNVNLTGNVTVTGTLSLSGSSATSRLLIQNSTIGTPAILTVTGATVSTNNVDFQDITFARTDAGGLDLTNGGANLIGDCGGNSRTGGDGTVTFTTAAPQTWNGTSGGNWSTNAWSGRAPLPQDDVSFGTMGVGQTITVDMPRMGKSVSFASATNTPTVLMNVTGLVYWIYGSYNLTGVGTYTVTKPVAFGARTDATLTTNGKNISSGAMGCTIAMPGATLTFADAVTSSGSIVVTNGTISTAYAVTCYLYAASSGTTTTIIGSPTWTITGANGYWNMAVGATFNCGASTIAYTYTGATATPFYGGTSVYNNITIAPGSGVLTFSGAFSFANMTMSGAGTKTVKFTKSTQYTMTGTSFLSGTSGNVVTIDSDDGATAFTLSKSSGIVTSNYLSIKNSTATGGAKWYGANSTNNGNNSGWMFGAKSPGYVSASPSGYSRTNSFTFSWAVTGPDAALYANKYQYRISPSGTWTDVPGDGTTSSISPTAPAYQIGSNVFYLRGVDITGNADPSGPQTTFYYNADAPSAPVALTADPSSSLTNSFSFSWTPPVTHSGNISGYYYSINSLPTITNSTFTTDTSLPTAPYATQQGTNTIYVLAKDEAGNVSFDSCSSISGNTDEDSCSSTTFAANTSAPAIPLGPTAVDGSDRDAQAYQVFLVWDTPETQSLDFAQYNIYRSDDNQYFSLVGTTTSTSYSDTGLASQPYYYYVKSKDNADNESAQSATVTMTPTGRYTSAPALSDGPTVTAKVFSASIAWDTDREATSIVKYSKDRNNLDKEASHATEFVKAHQIDIQGLDPESIYYYQLLWIDQDGNQGTKSDLSFTTGAKPKIESVKISNITLNAATISWSSTTASTSNINYGESVSYGSSVQEQSGSQTTNHTLNITNLKDSSKYHFQITGIDTDNTALTSDDYSFNTLTKPSISGLTYEPVTDAPTTTLKFNFKTNIPTTTIISYQINSANTKNQSNSDYQQDHEMIIHDLADASTYTFQAKGVDQYGNTVQSDKKTFTTLNDTRPPKVSNLTIEVKATGFSDGQKAQVVASWQTDEASTSFIQYGQGISGSDYPNKTNEDAALTTNHVIILSQLDPNKIYHLRVASADKSGNIGYSPDTTTITGKIQSSVIDIIIAALKNSLWWLFGFL